MSFIILISKFCIKFYKKYSKNMTNKAYNEGYYRLTNVIDNLEKFILLEEKILKNRKNEQKMLKDALKMSKKIEKRR